MRTTRHVLARVVPRDRQRAGWVFVANLVVVGTTLLYEPLSDLPVALLILLTIGSASLLTAIGPLVDVAREARANERLKVQKRVLAASKKSIQSELDELKSVVVSFLEHSEVYRERVRRYLRLGDDYLCVVKSSEGLSKVWAAMEQKELLPFGSYLLKLPGAVKPVERIGLFLIPFSSLPGITEGTIRSYFTRWIIPAVEEEREGFLQRQPRRIARSAEPFSYKYIAFPVRTGTIAFDTRNRKFNREFMSFIVAHQGGADYEGMKDELQEMVKGKDLLALTDWSSFADLNPAQRALVEAKRREMSERLAEAGVDGIVPLSEITPERFRDVVWPALYRRSSKIKTLNIGKKVVSGAAETVRVLRKHGITI